MLLSSGIRREAIFAGREDVLGRVRGHQSDRWQLNETKDMMQTGWWLAPPRTTRAAAVAVSAPSATEDRIARLRELAELKSDGALTDDELSAQKARILEGS